MTALEFLSVCVILCLLGTESCASTEINCIVYLEREETQGLCIREKIQEERVCVEEGWVCVSVINHKGKTAIINHSQL